MRASPDGIEPVAAHHEDMNLPRARPVNTLIDRPRWRSVAIVLEVAAAVTVSVCGLYYVFLRVSIEPTTEDLFRARVASHLLPFVSLAAMLLVLGILVSRPTVIGRNAYALGAIVAVVSISLPVGAAVHAHSQLHPPLRAEHAAMAKFVPPPGVIGQSTSVAVQLHSCGGSGAAWTVPGSAQANRADWAAAQMVAGCPLIVQIRLTTGVAVTARKGSDHVTLAGFDGAGNSVVNLNLALTREG